MPEQSSPLVSLAVAPEGTYIIARMIGEHSVDMALAATRRLQAFIRETGLRKVLVEAPQQRQMFDTLPTMTFGAMVEALAVPRCLFAIVVAMDLSQVRFTETVLMNRRIAVRYFNDVDQARAWLRVTPDQP